MAPNSLYPLMVVMVCCIVFSSYIAITRLVYESPSLSNVLTMSILTIIINSMSLLVLLVWVRRQVRDEEETRRTLLPT